LKTIDSVFISLSTLFIFLAN